MIWRDPSLIQDIQTLTVTIPGLLCDSIELIFERSARDLLPQLKKNDENCTACFHLLGQPFRILLESIHRMKGLVLPKVYRPGDMFSNIAAPAIIPRR